MRKLILALLLCLCMTRVSSLATVTKWPRATIPRFRWSRAGSLLGANLIAIILLCLCTYGLLPYLVLRESQYPFDTTLGFPGM